MTLGEGISLTIHKPPSWNSVYKTSRSGHLYMTKAGKDWKTLTVARLRTSTHCAGVETIHGKVHIDYKIYLANVERADIDNRLKLTNDVLESAGVIINDNRIFSANMVKLKCHAESQRIELTIYEYKDDTDEVSASDE